MKDRGGVLIVDDDAEIREVLAIVLTEEGYQVTCACDGAEGLAVLRAASQPLVVLLDLMMPVMDGVSVCRLLAADPTLRDDHVIVLMSAHHRLEHVDCPLAQAVIAKPFDVAALLALVERLAQSVQTPCERSR